MQNRKKKTRQAAAVQDFATQLRKVRISRGMTQAELAHKARVSEAYLGRLERAEATPGIDLVARLGVALGTTAAELQPSSPPPDEVPLLKSQAQDLLDTILRSDNREVLMLLCPLLRLLADRTK